MRIFKFLLAAGVAGFAPAIAKEKQPPQFLSEVTLDLDRDGKMDRAVAAKDPDSAYADLYIYLAVGDEKLDLSRKPTFLKKDLTTDQIFGLKNKANGSLLVRYGRWGSNQYENTLTIVYRGGRFLVAGFASEWDTRSGIGSCDINFLTGTGVASRGPIGKSKPIRRKFTPLKLSDWSGDSPC